METSNEAKISKSRSLEGPGRVHGALEPGESRSSVGPPPGATARERGGGSHLQLGSRATPAPLPTVTAPAVLPLARPPDG